MPDVPERWPIDYRCPWSSEQINTGSVLNWRYPEEKNSWHVCTLGELMEAMKPALLAVGIRLY